MSDVPTLADRTFQQLALDLLEARLRHQKGPTEATRDHLRRTLWWIRAKADQELAETANARPAGYKSEEWRTGA